MAMMEISVSEISRVAAWSLRGLGMSFGVADRAAALVGWAEAVEGGALKGLREITSELDGPRPTNWHRQLSETAWAFDASGRSLLEVGPIAIDLLTLAARAGLLGRVDIVNSADPIFLSAILRLAAKRRVGVIALGSGCPFTICGTPATSLHVAPGATGAQFAEVGEPPNEAIEEAIAACRQHPLQGNPNRMAVSLLSYRAPDRASPLAGAPTHFDAETKYTSAQSRGVMVSREELEHLYALELRTWAPTSDRSRSQALA